MKVKIVLEFKTFEDEARTAMATKNYSWILETALNGGDDWGSFEIVEEEGE